MYKQKTISKYIIILAAVLIITSCGYIIIRNIYDGREAVNDIFKAPNNEVQPAFKDTSKGEIYLDLNEISRNIFVHILNGIIPSAKANIENHYDSKMPSYLTSTINGIAARANFSVSDPKTYVRFILTALGQYKGDSEPASFIGSNNELPNITNFEDAPEGAIYFSEYEESLSEQNTANINGEDAQSSFNTQNAQESEEYFEKPDRLALSKKQPEVLLYHTHTTESYMPITSGNSHTMDERYNVVSVGNTITSILEKDYSYKVIHDKTYHDAESYAYSYANSLLTIRNQLSKNKGLKVIMDIHRDGFPIETSEENLKQKKKEYTISIDGKSAARVMLVIGKDNPNYDELEKFAVYIKKKMDTLYPGLLLKIERKEKAKYNQYFSNYSMLIEIGCNLNTNEEANFSAEIMGNVIGEALKDLEE